MQNAKNDNDEFPKVHSPVQGERQGDESYRRDFCRCGEVRYRDFMLERILQALKIKGKERKDVGVNVGVRLSARERDLLELLRLDGTLTAARIAETYSISTRQAERLLTGL